MNIGDTFKIKYKEIYRAYPNMIVCENQNSIFTANSFSKSGLSVYYFNSTRCVCNICTNGFIASFSGVENKSSIGIVYTEVVETFLQKNRNEKLNRLGI